MGIVYTLSMAGSTSQQQVWVVQQRPEPWAKSKACSLTFCREWIPSRTPPVSDLPLNLMESSTAQRNSYLLPRPCLHSSRSPASLDLRGQSVCGPSSSNPRTSVCFTMLHAHGPYPLLPKRIVYGFQSQFYNQGWRTRKPQEGSRTSRLVSGPFMVSALKVRLLLWTWIH